MGRQKTIFKKYLITSMSIVMVSFLFLGTMLFVFFLQYFKNEKSTLLIKNAQTISSLTSSNIVISGANFTLGNKNIIEGVVNTFSISSNMDIIITNMNGDILIVSEAGNKGKYTHKSIPKEVISEAVSNQNYLSDNSFNDIYNDSCYVSGVPISNNYSAGSPVGVVFTVTSSKSIGVFILDIFRVFLFAAVIALMLTFFAAWFLSYKMVRPLEDMSKAAKSFACGDFTKRVNSKTNDEIGKLAFTFNEMAKSLETAEETRRMFISNTSHELRTPMTSIAGFIDGILDGTIPNEKQHYYLNIVSDEIKRLSRLVKSMRSLSEIDNNDIELNVRKYYIHSSISNILIMLNDDIKGKGITINGENSLKYVRLKGDSDLLYQVFQNIISNAVKFTDKGGYINFTSCTNDGKITISIKNSGEGLSERDIPFIFEKFYKADKSRSKDTKGMGLGLYIANTIVKLHGGQILVDSIKDEYCTFNVILPN